MLPVKYFPTCPVIFVHNLWTANRRRAWLPLGLSLVADLPCSLYHDLWKQMQKLFCWPLKWGKSDFGLRLLFHAIAWRPSTRSHQTALVWALLWIWNFVYLLTCSSIYGKQVRATADWVGRWGGKGQVSPLAPCLLPFSQQEWGECHAAYQSMTWDLKAWNMALEQGCLLSGQQRKLMYWQRKSSLGIMASS